MATLVFSALGTLVGGPIGGAIGALVGRQVDAAIIGSPNREGPRLKELSVTTSSYGTAVPRYFGRMRAAGSIIWSTELIEHSETQGGAKGQPSVTSYSYTASFAVALSSRPIMGIGRIWADGNLLRGAGGDLKTPGTMRIYTGQGDQAPDPLIALTEGNDRCPAFRGLAYVVFEDLELGDFFNRIPALTFEVLSDDQFTLQQIIGEVVPGTEADLPLDGIEGFACEGPLIDALIQLDPVSSLDTDVSSDILVIARERLQTSPISLPEASISVADDDFGGPTGFTRKRSPVRLNPPEILRYYDSDRDFLPGLQRATGRAKPGQPATLELGASLSAANARALVEKMARRADWSRDRLAWRTSELDPLVAPGSIVVLNGQAGRWRVQEWEWRESGIELSLEHIVPSGADEAPAVATDPGRLNPPSDLPAATTELAAFELPWDGFGSGDTPTVFAAVSSSASNWSGAALFVDHGDAELDSLGPSGRTRSTIGWALDPLPPTSALLADRTSSLVVELAGNDMSLADATARQIAFGANRALVGSEIVQFMHAAPLGNRQWQLQNILRGRAGTELAIESHQANERFVLLDARPVLLDASIVRNAPGTQVVAVGRGDSVPAVSGIALSGSTLRPLFPVHPRIEILGDGTMMIGWTRRARGAWSWNDGVETPLHEQSESYLVGYGPVASPLSLWIVDTPSISLTVQDLAELAAQLADGALWVQQRGTHGLSEPLFLTYLP